MQVYVLVTAYGDGIDFAPFPGTLVPKDDEKIVMAEVCLTCGLPIFENDALFATCDCCQDDYWAGRE